MTTDLDRIEFNLEMLATWMEAIANKKQEIESRFLLFCQDHISHSMGLLPVVSEKPNQKEIIENLEFKLMSLSSWLQDVGSSASVETQVLRPVVNHIREAIALLSPLKD